MRDAGRDSAGVDGRASDALLALGRFFTRWEESSDGLQLLPVSYALHHGAIVFRTSPYGVLSELVRPVEVNFEVDDLDSETRTGWSVVVTGRAQAVAEPRDLVELWTVDGVTPWAAGVRTLFIEVTPRQITGRLFGSTE